MFFFRACKSQIHKSHLLDQVERTSTLILNSEEEDSTEDEKEEDESISLFMNSNSFKKALHSCFEKKKGVLYWYSGYLPSNQEEAPQGSNLPLPDNNDNRSWTLYYT